MESEVLIQLVLAFAGLAAFIVVLVERIRLQRTNGPHISRLLLVDWLLVVAGIELAADALYEAIHAEPWHTIFEAIAFVCRGALVAGGIALAATVEQRGKEFRPHTRRPSR